MEPTAVTYLRWIPLLPLLGAAANGLFGSAIQRRFGKGVVGAEFVCPAVTSPGPVPGAAGDVVAAQLRFVSPHLKYINLNRRGYGVLDLTHEAATCEIYHVATVDAKSDQETLATVMVSEVGNNLVRGEGQKTPRL